MSSLSSVPEEYGRAKCAAQDWRRWHHALFVCLENRHRVQRRTKRSRCDAGGRTATSDGAVARRQRTRRPTSMTTNNIRSTKWLIGALMRGRVADRRNRRGQAVERESRTSRGSALHLEEARARTGDRERALERSLSESATTVRAIAGVDESSGICRVLAVEQSVEDGAKALGALHRDHQAKEPERRGGDTHCRYAVKKSPSMMWPRCLPTSVNAA